MKNLLLVILIFVSSNAFALTTKTYGFNTVITRTTTDKYLKEEIINADGFITCVADGDGSGGQCKIYSGYAVINEGTYREVLQKERPGAIYKGYSMIASSESNRKTIHLFYSLPEGATK